MQNNRRYPDPDTAASIPDFREFPVESKQSHNPVARLRPVVLPPKKWSRTGTRVSNLDRASSPGPGAATVRPDSVRVVLPCSRNTAPRASNKRPPSAAHTPGSEVSPSSRNAAALHLALRAARKDRHQPSAATDRFWQNPPAIPVGTKSQWNVLRSFQVFASKHIRRFAQHHRTVKHRVERVVHDQYAG